MHIDSLRYCWPKITTTADLCRKSDILLFTTKEVDKSTISKLWKPEKVRVELYNNPGYEAGSILALSRALEMRWFDGYDWVVRINPDVIIRDDHFILENMLDKGVDGIFASCSGVDYCKHPQCTQVQQVNTDFFAVRPRILSPGPVVHDNAEDTFTRMVMPTILAGRDRWLPDQYGS